MATVDKSVRRAAWELITEASGIDKPISFNETAETFFERWLTPKYGGIRLGEFLQIGGQAPGSGPDVLKFIKKHDPQNTAGAVKDALDIMLKLQEAANTDSLMASIQPLQDILGGGLYNKMQKAGSTSKSGQKTQDHEERTGQDNSIIASLIAAALECTDKKSSTDRDLAVELLDDNEISAISRAYYHNETYESVKMPKTFVDCINQLIPIFRSAKEAIV